MHSSSVPKVLSKVCPSERNESSESILARNFFLKLILKYYNVIIQCHKQSVMHEVHEMKCIPVNKGTSISH